MMGSLTPPLLKPDVTLSLTLTSPSLTPQEMGIQPEERGIRLIQLLLKCAKHASSGNLHRANACLGEISELSSVTGDSMQRLAARFASALAIRLVKRWPGIYKSLNHNQQHQVDQNQARDLFARSFPYLGFTYAIIARALLQAMSLERIIHLVDLGSGDSKLWVPLVRSFANLPYGPPHLKVTCVNSNMAALDKLRQRLVKEAEAVDIPFQFNPINVSLRELTIDMLKVRSGEALAFISILNLHGLLAEDDRVDAHFGASNKNNNEVKDCKQMSDFLMMIRTISPKLLFIVEQETDHNSNRLLDRFVEGLHYYSAMFDSIDSTFGTSSNGERFVMEEMFGREIENIVAGEGVERFERHERYARWAVRFGRAGFRPVRLWNISDEDAKQMVDAFGKDGYKIVRERTSLMICWHDRPLYAVTAWTC